MKAYQLIAPDHAWLQGGMAAIRSMSAVVLTTNPKADCFCAAGAIFRKHGVDGSATATPDCAADFAKVVDYLIEKGLWPRQHRSFSDDIRTVTRWNDVPSRKQIEVFAVLRECDV